MSNLGNYKAARLILLGMLILPWPGRAQDLTLTSADDPNLILAANPGLRSPAFLAPPGTITGQAVFPQALPPNRLFYIAQLAHGPIAAPIHGAIPPPLGAADDVAILAATTVTNSGATVITGNIALTPGTSVTGFPPGTVVGGAIHINDALATQAHAGALAAYNQLTAEISKHNLTGTNLGGLTLTPGIYHFDNAAQLTGTLRLDTGGDPNAPFHFQIGTNLTTSSSSLITLLNGNSVNLFWQVGASATLGAGSSFSGTIIANQNITLENGASLDGRALALNGAVTLDNNTVTIPTATPGATPAATPEATAHPGSSATPVPSATATPPVTPNSTATPPPTVVSAPTPTPGPSMPPGPTATPPPAVTLAPLPTPFAPGRVDRRRLTHNQLAVLQAYERLAALHPTYALVQEVNVLSDPDFLTALDLLSPEDLASIFTSGFSVLHVQMDNIEHRLSDVRQGTSGFTDSSFAANDSYAFLHQVDGKDVSSRDDKEVVSSPPAPAPSDHRWGFFISGSGEFVDVENTSEARGYSFDTGGATVGADYRITNHLVLGTAFGYANTAADLNLGGRLRSNEGNGSLYATYYDKGFYLDGLVGGGYRALDTRRLTVGGVARGDTEGCDFDALLGSGYEFHFGAFAFGPVFSFRYTRVSIDEFNEEGALGSLRINSQSEESLRSEAGLQASYTAMLGRVSFTPFVRAQWEHEFLTSTPTVDAGFIPGDTFTVNGPHLGRDGALVDAGIGLQLTPTVGLFSYYTGRLGRENYNVQGVTGGLRVSF